MMDTQTTVHEAPTYEDEEGLVKQQPSGIQLYNMSNLT